MRANLVMGVRRHDDGTHFQTREEHIKEEERVLSIATRIGLKTDLIRRSTGYEQDDLWMETLSRSELAKVHLARAFITNPEVMVLRQPTAHFSLEEDKAVILGMLSEHVSLRGLSLPANDFRTRRTRTV